MHEAEGCKKPLDLPSQNQTALKLPPIKSKAQHLWNLVTILLFIIQMIREEPFLFHAGHSSLRGAQLSASWNFLPLLATSPIRR